MNNITEELWQELKKEVVTLENRVNEMTNEVIERDVIGGIIVYSQIVDAMKSVRNILTRLNV